MSKYIVSAQVTISIHCCVEADSEKEAKEKAAELPLLTFCHQCASGTDDPEDAEWRTSGELDGTPMKLVAEIEE